MDKTKIFREMELEANRYVARCLLITGGIAAIIWFLNIINFFTVSDLVMNTSMPIGILVLLSPSLFIQKFNCQGSWVKYYACICFVLGIAIIHAGMTYQVILAWACPLVLSCHYYSPRVTRVTFLVSLLLLLLSIFVGVYVGSWDANMMLSVEEFSGIAARHDYIMARLAEGKNYLLRILNLYYFPRALILTGIYVIATTLSRRTHRLMDKQQANFLERERIGAELSVATDIQNSMLPNTFPAYPRRPEFELFASMTPSKEVGGDFYDYFLVDDDHLALVMADVSGKGVPAAMFMMSTKIMIKNLTACGKTPAQVLMEVNNQLCETNKNDMFVTVWFGIYEISTGNIIATNAGHEYPVIQRKGCPFEMLQDKHGFVIGGMEGMKYRNYEFQLEQGDALFLYTDGVLEAINHTEEGYGMDRLLAQLNRTQTDSLELTLQGVKADVDSFAGELPQFDDITMLAIRRNELTSPEITN